MPNAPEGEPLQDLPAVVEIRTTFSCQDRAAACAKRLVHGRLAACVQIEGPVTSVYRWQGVVETTQEFRCTCKTSLARAESCVAAILSGHEYETPEMIVTISRASTGYAAWVLVEVATNPQDGDQGHADRPA